MSSHKFESVDQYIESFPARVQIILNHLRQMVCKLAPDAHESMSYGMPAYKWNGKVLIYFAAFKNHIGLYATPNTHQAFKKELAPYKQGKGSVQFPLQETMPYDLIQKIILFNKEKM